MMKVILQTLRHTNHEDSTSEEDTDEASRKAREKPVQAVQAVPSLFLAQQGIQHCSTGS